MFVRETEPVIFSEEGLLGLCASLNRPVVDVEPLPSGPARAAIALHRTPSGESCLAFAVRSIECGVVCIFTFRGAPRAPVHEAMDIGLSFAESMGFLFDDDMIGASDGTADGIAAIDDAAGTERARGAAHALAFWCDLIGEARPPVREPRREPARDPLRAVAGPPGEVLGDVPLSKFRGPEAPPPEARQAELGRIPIVRRRVREEGAAGANFFTRLRGAL